VSDIFSAKKRSEIMGKVKSSKNKTTELRLIDFFKLNKIIGWRRNYKLFGKPDFTFPKLKITVFVDGCFWHGHNCGRNLTPKQNGDYWSAKQTKNRERDLLVTSVLQEKGWEVIRIWECELKKDELLRGKLGFNAIDI